MIHRLVRLKAFSAFKIGSEWRFNLEEIDAWLLELSGKRSMALSNGQATIGGEAAKGRETKKRKR
jgi:hypothetical protein